MKYIGNILTEGLFNNNELFNVVSTKENLIPGIPTLCVGWEFTKANYPNANIINWKIDDNTYWTFGNRERRNRFTENVSKFKKISLERFIKSVEYKFLSLVIADQNEKVDLNNMLCSQATNVYINNDMVYLNQNNSNIIVGFSLKDIDFMGKSRKNIFERLNKASLNQISRNFNKISADTKIQLKNYNYVIPYLFS